MTLSSTDVRLVPIQGDSLLYGDRILGHADLLGGAKYGLLVSFPGDVSETQLPVRLFSDQQIPTKTLFISQELADRMGLMEGVQITWELRTSGFQEIMATQLTLELTVEQPIEETLFQLNDSRELAEHLIHVLASQDPAGLSMEIHGLPYRVRDLAPPCVSETIYEISRSHTHISVLFPSNRSGVDIAILADCSGSMEIEDLTEVSEKPSERRVRFFGRTAPEIGERPVKRIQALRNALDELLQRRRRISGSTSRIALIAFGNVSECRFPKRGLGMIEIDENTPDDVIQQFRDSIGLLRVERWSTDIGQALQFAASHISNYGKPENERLIVLISDGANWKPKGKDDGEMIDALQEPVSLMEQLHETMNIHLHAIGISNGEIYDRYLRRTGHRDEPNSGLRPNHELLEHLVSVGGGDPTRIGDASVLEEYLQGLGAGVTRSLPVREDPRAPLLSNSERQKITEAVRERGTSGNPKISDTALKQLSERLWQQFLKCNDLYASFFGKLGDWLFNVPIKLTSDAFGAQMCWRANSRFEFERFITYVHMVFNEGLPEKLQEVSRKPEKIANLPLQLQEVAKITAGPEFKEVGVLRNKLNHLSNPADVQRVSEIMEKLLGLKYLSDDDAEGWFRMQVAILTQISDALDRLEKIFANAQTSSTSQQDSSAPVVRW